MFTFVPSNQMMNVMTINKKILMMCLCLAGAVAGLHAQSFLGDNHAMKRVTASQRFLLLPVEEKEENAHVNVIVDNKVVKQFNCRLAVDHVDYYVPLELQSLGAPEALLDITFQGERRAKGVIKDFSCWQNMKYADAFDTRNTERFRPSYHHTPAYGWMNDPNGMFYKDGVWHLYFQYNPYGSQWENMTWGHSTSRDLVTWTQQPNAIEPDGLGTIFSGSAVVDKNNTAGFGAGAVVAIYTSAGASQVQSLAYSTDGGQTFTKYAGNPVITGDVPDFRDPNVFWNDETGEWNLVLAAGQEVRFYSSKDLKEWRYESSFGNGYGNHDGVWECPDMLRLPVEGIGSQKWALILNINPGGPFGGSATQYFTGTFDGHKFTCESSPSTTKWMDFGKDHYATVTFDNAPSGRAVAMAWMSNWQYANQVPTRQFRSANSIARDLYLFDSKGETYMASAPSKEMEAVRGRKTPRPAETSEIEVDVKGSFTLTLKNRKGEEVVMSYDAAAQTLAMNRSKSGDTSFSEAFAATTTAPTFGPLKTLRLFVDRCSIEAFGNNGKTAMTNLVFPSEPYNALSIKGKAKATVYELKTQPAQPATK